MNCYPNRAAAINSELIPLLGDDSHSYDITELADRTLDWIPDGYGMAYFLNPGVDFWAEAAACRI